MNCPWTSFWLIHSTAAKATACLAPKETQNKTRSRNDENSVVMESSLCWKWATNLRRHRPPRNRGLAIIKQLRVGNASKEEKRVAYDNNIMTPGMRMVDSLPRTFLTSTSCLLVVPWKSKLDGQWKRKCLQLWHAGLRWLSTVLRRTQLNYYSRVISWQASIIEAHLLLCRWNCTPPSFVVNLTFFAI